MPLGQETIPLSFSLSRPPTAFLLQSNTWPKHSLSLSQVYLGRGFSIMQNIIFHFYFDCRFYFVLFFVFVFASLPLSMTCINLIPMPNNAWIHIKLLTKLPEKKIGRGWRRVWGDQMKSWLILLESNQQRAPHLLFILYEKRWGIFCSSPLPLPLCVFHYSGKITKILTKRFLLLMIILIIYNKQLIKPSAALLLNRVARQPRVEGHRVGQGAGVGSLWFELCNALN